MPHFIAAYRKEHGSRNRSADPSAPTRGAPRTKPMARLGELVTTSGELLAATTASIISPLASARVLESLRDARSTWCKLNPLAKRVSSAASDELRRDSCDVRDVNWISWETLREPIEAMVKIRYRHEPAAALVEPTGSSARASVSASRSAPSRQANRRYFIQESKF